MTMLTTEEAANRLGVKVDTVWIAHAIEEYAEPPNACRLVSREAYSPSSSSS